MCDSVTIRRYGLGMAKPFPVPLMPYLRSGYLKRGATLEALAEQTGVDTKTLVRTVQEFNIAAQEGRDPEFGKGGSAYNVYQSDSNARPGPCVAPLDKPPYYAVRIYPGDLGTFAGLRTDEHARVLTAAGVPVPGLYAAGTNMASVFAGHYPGPGINLGPAMTFGYIATRHMSRQRSGGSGSG